MMGHPARGLRQRLADQLARPTGIAGRMVAASLNRRNSGINSQAIKTAQIRPGDRALDIGFGGGVGLAALLASPADHVTGLELSADMVAAARRRFADEVDQGRLDLNRGSVSRLPFENASFDCVVSVNTLYFWPDPETSIREMVRVLTPKGRMVLAIVPPQDLTRRKLDRHGFRIYDETTSPTSCAPSWGRSV